MMLSINHKLSILINLSEELKYVNSLFVV